MGSNVEEENNKEATGKAMEEEEGERTATIETVPKEIEKKEVEPNPPWALLVPVTSGENIKIRGEEFTVGRSNRCTLKLDDKHVSSVHFKISREQIGPGGSKVASIIDLSSNGTFLNSKRMDKKKKYYLKHQDKINLIQLGAKVFFYSYMDLSLASHDEHPEISQKYEIRQTLGK